MWIRDESHRTIDLRTLSDIELQELAYDHALSRAALVAVVAEIRRRRERHERHDTPTRAR